MTYWLFVLPLPDQPFRYRRDQDDNVAELQQLGWQIRYTDYRTYDQDPESRPLPRKLTAVRQLGAEEGQRITVKLVTKSWQW